MLCKNWYLQENKKYQTTPTKQHRGTSWGGGVVFRISDDQARPCYMGVPPLGYVTSSIRIALYHRKKYFTRGHPIFYFTLRQKDRLCSRKDDNNKENRLILKCPQRLRLMEAACYWQEVLAKRLAHLTPYQELQH